MMNDLPELTIEEKVEALKAMGGGIVLFTLIAVVYECYLWVRGKPNAWSN